MSRSRKRLKARRRAATLSSLARVISGSATRRSSLALGRVVLMISCSNRLDVMLRNIALRCDEVLFSLRPDLRWRMVVSSVIGARHQGRRQVFLAGAKRRLVAGKNRLDFSQ